MSASSQLRTIVPWPEFATGHDDCELLRRLRETPQLLADLEQTSGSELQVQTRLRQHYDDALVRQGLLLRELRQRATTKFSRAAAMWFDRQGLEQSTSEAVARHKAERFSGRVYDLCCGIGGDVLALAGRCEVVACDLQPVTALRALWNAEAYGVDGRVTTTAAAAESMPVDQEWVHIDPDRRPGSVGRVSRVEDYVPGLDYLQSLLQRAKGGAIKLGPASNFGGKFRGVETELISLNGECKEATIWFGELAGGAEYRATALPSGATIAGHPLDAVAEQSRLRAWIYDPDPAVVRAGLVDLLAEQLGLCRLDAAEEYLTCDTYVESPFLQGFEVTGTLANQEREIRQALRTSDFGSLEIKCRHIPVQADVLRRRLPLPGTKPGVLIFARIQGKAHAILARRP